MNLLTTLFIFYALSISFSAQADSPVWKVSKDSKHVFIGGTIHVLSQTDYPLPAQFEQAYVQADTLVFETDMQAMQTPVAQQMLLAKVIYPAGQTIKQNVSSDTFKKLEYFFVSRGLPIDNFLMFKPGMIAITLTIIELQTHGLDGTGVDEFYTLKAINDEKTLSELETLEQQIDFIGSLGLENPDRVINYTLRDIESLVPMMGDLKTAWRTGNSEELNKLIVNTMKNDFPNIYKTLLLNRNNAWVPQIEAMIETDDIEFILVGAAHLVGEDSVLTQLEQRGYLIEML